MASDQSALIGPTRVATVALSATATNSTAITGPVWARQVTITFLTSAVAADSGSLAFDGTDGAAIDADFYPIASGGSFTFTVKADDQIAGAAPIFYVTASTASATCRVLFEEARP